MRGEQFRRFHQYSFEQVLETMRMLYSLRPIPLDRSHDSGAWSALAEQAFAWLDYARAAYDSTVIFSRGMDAFSRGEQRRTEKRDKELKGLPDPVPYEKAVCKIMRDGHFDRVHPRFKELMRSGSPSLEGKRDSRKRPVSPLLRHNFERIGATPEQLLKRWPKKGIPLAFVHLLHLAHERDVERHQADAKEKHAKKRSRKIRHKHPEDLPAVLELKREWDELKASRERKNSRGV
jgi:hypothetical protein